MLNPQIKRTIVFDAENNTVVRIQHRRGKGSRDYRHHSQASLARLCSLVNSAANLNYATISLQLWGWIAELGSRPQPWPVLYYAPGSQNVLQVQLHTNTRKERTMNDNTGPIDDALTKLNAAQRWSVSCPQGPEDFDELMRAIADGEHDLHLLDFAQRIEQRFAIPVNEFDWDQVSLLIERDRLTADEVDRMIHAGLR